MPLLTMKQLMKDSKNLLQRILIREIDMRLEHLTSVPSRKWLVL